MQTNVAKYLFTRTQQMLLVLLLCVDGLYFALTNPQQEGTWRVIVGTGLVMLSVYAGCWAMVHVIAGFIRLSVRMQRLIGLAVSGPLIYGLLMQSIGQLNARDLLAAIPLAGVAYFYVVYGRSGEQNGQSKH